MHSPSDHLCYRLVRSVAVVPLLVLIAVPGSANVLPESGLLTQVGPSPGGVPIVNCSQLVTSTTATGEVEFVVYFMRCGVFPPDEWLCLGSLTGDLRWPAGWDLIESEAFGGGSCDLDPVGVDVHIPGIRDHNWSMSWPWPPLPIGMTWDSVVPILRLVLDVVEPGRLDPWWADVELRHDCIGDVFHTYPSRGGAYAGLACGFYDVQCLEPVYCFPSFSVDVLELSVPTGSAVRDTVELHNGHNEYIQCGYSIETHAPWCTAQYYDHMQYPPYDIGWLDVDIDTTDLAPGTYATEIELRTSRFGRCLPVVVEVTDAVVTESLTWGAIKALYH